jgi:GNAT superfamily N-acetyltransferase
MKIIRQAQVSLKEAGVDQWQNNYPTVDIIRSDIHKGYSYVLLKNEKIAATAAVSFTGETIYDSIYEGKWSAIHPYAIIQRIAVSSSEKGQGFASAIIKQVEQLCLKQSICSIRMVTHEENRSMRKLLWKNQFQYCGIIHLHDGSKRIAFEKALHHIPIEPLPMRMQKTDPFDLPDSYLQ